MKPQCRSLLAPFARVPRSLESKTHILIKENNWIRGKSRFPVFHYNIVKSRAIVSSLLPRCTCDFLLFFLCGRSNMGRDRKFLFRFSDFQIFRNEKDGCPEASVGFSTRRAVTPTFRRFHGRRRRMAEDTMATRKLRRRRARERERERERERRGT